jgi:DNA-binding transcriptional LysR family regulator
MDPQHLDLHLLPVLDALLSEGSASRAADVLGVSQSAISHSLRRLRDYFQDPLFVRSGSRMLPTAKALELAPTIRTTMEQVRDRLVPGARFEPQQARRVFTVCMTDMAEVYFLPRLASHLRTLAPGCRLRTVLIPPRDIASALERRDIDLAIGAQRLPGEGLYQQRLIEQPLVCIAAGENPRLRAGLNAEAYFELPHLAIDPFDEDVDIYEWLFADFAGQRRIVMTSHSFLSVPLLVAHTDLVATVPACLVPSFPQDSNLKVWPVPIELSTLVMRQTWHPRFHTDPATVWLRQQLFTLFATEPAGTS